MIDASTLQMLLFTVTSWLDRRERETLAYLIEENRVLRRQIGRQHIRLTDEDRRKLAAPACRLGRQAFRSGATIKWTKRSANALAFGARCGVGRMNG